MEASAHDARTVTSEAQPGALDDLEKALVYQGEVIDRLTAKVAPLTDPHGFADLVKIDDAPAPRQSRLRELIARVVENTERIHRLDSEIDV